MSSVDMDRFNARAAELSVRAKPRQNTAITRSPWIYFGHFRCARPHTRVLSLYFDSGSRRSGWRLAACWWRTAPPRTLTGRPRDTAGSTAPYAAYAMLFSLFILNNDAKMRRIYTPVLHANDSNSAACHRRLRGQPRLIVRRRRPHPV